MKDIHKEENLDAGVSQSKLIAFNRNLVKFNSQLFKIPSDTYLKTLNDRIGFVDTVGGWGAFFKLPRDRQNEVIQERFDSIQSDSPGGEIKKSRESLLCVDEWQDLHLAAYAILSKLFENIYVFMDDGQIITKGGGSTRWEIARSLWISSINVYHLTENFRNTKQIHDAFHSLRSTSTWEDTVPPSKVWEKPKYYTISIDDQLEHIVKICQKKKPGTIWNIGIIAKRKEEQDRIREHLSRHGVWWVQMCMGDASYGKEHYEPIDYDNHSVFILNTSNVKWLEFHEVILFNVGEDWGGDNHLYVSATRAREALHMHLEDDSVIEKLGLPIDCFERWSATIDEEEMEF